MSGCRIARAPHRIFGRRAMMASAGDCFEDAEACGKPTSVITLFRCGDQAHLDEGFAELAVHA